MRYHTEVTEIGRKLAGSSVGRASLGIAVRRVINNY